MVKLRLIPTGKSAQPSYRIVAIDSRSKLNGKYIAHLGTYNPSKNFSLKATKVETNRKSLKATKVETNRKSLSLKGTKENNSSQKYCGKAEINEEKALKFLLTGAQPTDTVRSLLSATGIMTKFHNSKLSKAATKTKSQKKISVTKKAKITKDKKIEVK